MSNKVRIFSLGGLDENGKNMYVLEINEDIFVFEAGIKYPEKYMPGIDMIIPKYDYLLEHKDKIKAIFISHGHDHVMAALPYITKDIKAPIFCSKVTNRLIDDTTQRLGFTPNYNYHIVNAGDEIEISGHKVVFFATTHSISQSLGIAVETGDGYVVYTGNFIIDYGTLPQYKTDINFISRLGDKKVLCLLAESNGSDKDGFTSPKHKLTPVVESVFAQATGRIVFSMHAQNIFGIREILDLAVKYKRKILIYNKQVENLYKHPLTEYATSSIPQSYFLKLDEANRPGNENIVIIISEIGERLIHALSKVVGGGSRHVILRPTDTFIVANKPLAGLEMLQTKVVDDIYRAGCKVINISKKQVVSMHPHAEDLKMMISLLRPKYYMPVDGPYNKLIANAQVAVEMNAGYNHTNVFVYDNGMVAQFENGVYKGFQEQIETGDVMIDGLGVGDVGGSVITDRQKLAEDGVVILGITVDTKNKEVVAGPDVQMRGVIFLKDADDFVTNLIKLFEETVVEYLNEDTISFPETKVKIRDKIHFFIRKSTGKEPLIMPVIIEI